MTMETLPKMVLGTTFKLVFVSLCAIALMGCAQFEDSFGELRSPEIQSSTVGGSNSEDSARSNDGSDDGSNRESGSAPSANGARSLMIGGVRVELANGQVTD